MDDLRRGAGEFTAGARSRSRPGIALAPYVHAAPVRSALRPPRAAARRCGARLVRRDPMRWRGTFAVAVVAGAVAWFGSSALSDEEEKGPSDEEMAKWMALAK